MLAAMEVNQKSATDVLDPNNRALPTTNPFIPVVISPSAIEENGDDEKKSSDVHNPLDFSWLMK